MNKTKISKIGRRGKIVLATLIALMFIGIASAEVKTVTVYQNSGASSGGALNWNNLSESQYRSTEQSVPQEEKSKVSVAVDVDAEYVNENGLGVRVRSDGNNDEFSLMKRWEF